MKKAVKIAWLLSFAVELVAVVLYFYYVVNQTATTLDGIGILSLMVLCGQLENTITLYDKE